MGAILDVAWQGRTMVLHGTDNSAITALAGQQSVSVIRWVWTSYPSV
jgi:hypothetical protein